MKFDHFRIVELPELYADKKIGWRQRFRVLCTSSEWRCTENEIRIICCRLVLWRLRKDYGKISNIPDELISIVRRSDPSQSKDYIPIYSSWIPYRKIGNTIMSNFKVSNQSIKKDESRPFSSFMSEAVLELACPDVPRILWVGFRSALGMGSREYKLLSDVIRRALESFGKWESSS